jgi:hypothetical protein
MAGANATLFVTEPSPMRADIMVSVEKCFEETDGDRRNRIVGNIGEVSHNVLPWSVLKLQLCFLCDTLSFACGPSAS